MNLLEQLRHYTQEQHQQLHVHPLLAPLQDNDITMQDYYWCLRAFYQAYAHAQSKLHYLGAKTDVPVMEWLEKDMQTHSVHPILLDIVSYPAIDNESKYLGYLYVTQGSTLGGRVISKHLQKKLGLIEGETNHFFAGFGSDTGSRWKSFLTLLDNTTFNQKEVVDQAVCTFLLIAQSCNKALKLKINSQLASCG